MESLLDALNWIPSSVLDLFKGNGDQASFIPLLLLLLPLFRLFLPMLSSFGGSTNLINIELAIHESAVRPRKERVHNKIKEAWGGERPAWLELQLRREAIGDWAALQTKKIPSNACKNLLGLILFLVMTIASVLLASRYRFHDGVFLGMLTVSFVAAVVCYFQLLFDVPNPKGVLSKACSWFCELCQRKDVQTISIHQMRLLADSRPYCIVDAREQKSEKRESWTLKAVEGSVELNLEDPNKEILYFTCSNYNRRSLRMAAQIKKKGATAYSVRNFFSHEREGKRIELELNLLKEEGLLDWQKKEPLKTIESAACAATTNLPMF